MKTPFVFSASGTTVERVGRCVLTGRALLSTEPNWHVRRKGGKQQRGVAYSGPLSYF